jgi:hypothetical protein
MDKTDNTNAAGEQHMDDIGQLVRFVGGRDTVPADRYGSARENVRMHWEQVVEEQRQPRLTRHHRVVALAASVLVAVVATSSWLRTGNVPMPDVLATVERVTGPAHMNNELLVPGDTLTSDARIETSSDGRIALRLSGGQSLRIDRSSEVILHAGNRLSLQGGGLYIDTESMTKAAPIMVVTSLGQALDVGTQYQVRYVDDVLTIGVREGQVEFTRPNRQKLAVGSGRFVDLAIDGTERERRASVNDPAWNWVEAVAPPFDIDGATLHEYLSWYVRQRGLQLEWSDQQSEQRAQAIRLSGSIADSSLEEGLNIVHHIAHFEHRIEGVTMKISVQ